MRLSRCIEDYLTTCRVRRLSTATLITYENSLNGLRNLALVNGRDEIGIFTPALIEEYFAKANAKGNSIPTLVKKRVALRRFADWGLRRRLWIEDPTLNAPAYRLPERLPRPFERRDRERLMALPVGIEEEALRAVLYYTGLRVSEVCGLRWANVRLGEGPGDRGRLVVIGKGNTERSVALMADLETILREYAEEYPPARSVYVFSHRGGHPWTPRMVRYRVMRWGQETGTVACTPHRWRHTAATELFEAGVDPRAAQRFMGHKSISTTMLYTRVVDAEVDRAADQRSAMLARRAEHARTGIST